jgi:hypothetical protein
MLGLELFWPYDLPEWCSQSTKLPLPNGVMSLARERRGGVDDLGCDAFDRR